MTFDDTPSIDDISRGTQLARRAPRRPAFGERQGDRQQEFIARHRAIDPRRVARHFLDRSSGFADQDQRAVGAEHLDDAWQVGLLRPATRRQSALRSARVDRSRPSMSRLSIGTGLVARLRKPFEKCGALARNRAGDADLDRVGGCHRQSHSSKATATRKCAIFRGMRARPRRNRLRFCGATDNFWLLHPLQIGFGGDVAERIPARAGRRSSRTPRAPSRVSPVTK